MTSVQGVLFAALIVMVLVWFYCVRSLARQLLQRHADLHEAMDLSSMWDISGRGNGKAVLSMLRFLLRKEYGVLEDPEITRLSAFMRWFFVAYMGMFGYLAFTIVRQQPALDPPVAAASSPSPAELPKKPVTEERRQAAYDLHRAMKWPQAIAAYDALLRDGGDNAEILFWRAMAQWKSAHFDEALRDFQRVIEMEPRHLDALRNADALLARQRRWDEIIAMWDRYIEREPPNAEAYFERGGTYSHKGDMAAARADAAKACELGKALACRMVERLKAR